MDYFSSVVTDPPHHIDFMGATWDSRKGGPAFQAKFWSKVLRVLKTGHYLVAKGNGHTYHRIVCAIEDAGFVIDDLLVRLNGNNNPKSKRKLKNDNEPICLAYKPQSPIALQIEACRIPAQDESYREKCASVVGSRSNDSGACYGAWTQPRSDSFSEAGRWPANVVCDEEAAEQLREVSKFFYCPRVSAAERGQLKHPTMTPVALTRWLVRLITPLGGVVLDPFAGSGSFGVGVGAKLEGFGFIGIEKDKANYLEAQGRLLCAA